MIAEVGDLNVQYNANLTSQGIQHMDTKIVAHPDINPAQQDLTSVMKWESLFSLGQAVEGLETLHEGHISMVKMKGLSRGYVW